MDAAGSSEKVRGLRKGRIFTHFTSESMNRIFTYFTSESMNRIFTYFTSESVNASENRQSTARSHPPEACCQAVMFTALCF